MKYWLHILKLRIYERLSFKISFRLFRELTSNERGEYSSEDYKKEYECEFVPIHESGEKEFGFNGDANFEETK